MGVRCLDAIVALRGEISVEIAGTRREIEEAQHLRQMVFCKERKYLPQHGLIETDEFDCRSHHVVLRYRSSGEVIGTVRLIIPAPGLRKDSLPIQRVSGANVLENIPLHTTAEISRFCLTRTGRDTSWMPNPMMRLGLVQGVLRVSRDVGITHWCATMEPSLLRLLRSVGIHFEARGPLVEYHGLRQPAVGCIETILERGKREQPVIWAFVTEQPDEEQWLPAPRRLAA